MASDTPHKGYFDSHGFHHATIGSSPHKRSRAVAGLAFVALSVLLLVAFGLRLESEGGELAVAKAAASAPNTYAASINADAGAAIKVISSSGFASLVEQATSSEVVEPSVAADHLPPPAADRRPPTADRRRR